jgi:hypothetical protein
MPLSKARMNLFAEQCRRGQSTAPGLEDRFDWLALAELGSRLTGHQGELARDRVRPMAASDEITRLKALRRSKLRSLPRNFR